jgi:HAD superfamily hydrolase (TIGR01509 family)
VGATGAPGGDGKIEAVAFDWDGTLVDSKAVLLGSFQETTAEIFGRPFPTEEADIEKFVQLRGEDAFSLLADGDPKLIEEIERVFHRHYTRLSQEAEPFPGTLETLERLRAAGLGIGVATSKARIRLDLEMERTGIGKLVDEEIAGDEVAHAKPDPECVREVIRRLGAAPERTIYVGDGPNDIHAAQAAGAIAVAVTFGFHPELIADAGPDHVIGTYSELLPLAGVAPAPPR